MDLEGQIVKKRTFFNTYVTWPNIRAFIEFASAIVLFAHFIPKTWEENLQETTLGLYIIFGIAIVLLIVHNSRNSRSFSDIVNMSKEDLYLKDQEIAILKEAIKIKEKEFASLVQANKYSRIFELSNKAFAELREAYREDRKANDQQKLRAALKEFCNNLHEIFDTINGVQPDRECHVCIKIFTQPSNRNNKSNSNVKVKVKTIMRDGRGNGKRNLIDRDNIDHFVNENTDFKELFEFSDSLNSRYFLSNDLLDITDYKNSSLKKFNADKTPYFKYSQSTKEIKEEKWPLPYRSVITSPICPGIARPNFKDGTFIGFVCVDYNTKEMFNSIDAEIVSGFAEGLYDVLAYYIDMYLLRTHA